VDAVGCTALLRAANHLTSDNFTTIQWLLEHGGADITNTTPDGRTVWNFLARNFLRFAERGDVATNNLTALLRVMVLQSAPPADLVLQMSLEHSQVVKEGVWLQARLPA
jgi:hypothetical protein